jgi:hypothetical protein
LIVRKLFDPLYSGKLDQPMPAAAWCLSCSPWKTGFGCDDAGRLESALLLVKEDGTADGIEGSALGAPTGRGTLVDDVVACL